MTLVNRCEVHAEVDSTRISLVLTNLIENAIKYNREHGEVTVTVDADEEYFMLSVADNGIGIPEEDQARIFERFFRVDKSRSREIGGTGLGLSITRSAILRHHGTISVESKEGEGTTFTVRIPLHYSVEPMELEVDKQRRQITRFLLRRKNRLAQKEYLEKTIQVSQRKYKPDTPAAPGPSSPDRSKADQSRPDQANTDQSRSDRTGSDQFKFDQSRYDQFRPEQYRIDQNGSGQTGSVQMESGQTGSAEEGRVQ